MNESLILMCPIEVGIEILAYTLLDSLIDTDYHGDIILMVRLRKVSA